MRESAGCHGGCAGSNVAARCWHRDPRTCRCSTSTAATWRSGCCTLPMRASAGRSIRLASPATPRWKAGSDANLIGAQPKAILAAEIGEWVELPIWVSVTGEAMAMHNGDVSAAYAAGLVCRPVQETITDTWHWLQAEGDPAVKEGRPGHGIDPEKERAFLASLG